MKRVLLTGASGFIGRHCVRSLLEKGYEIHGVSTRPTACSEDIYWHQADLLDRIQTRRLIEEVRPSHLLHFAWYAVPGKYWTAEENLDWLQASIDLLRIFADRGGERAVLAGTCAEYDTRFGYCSEDLTPLRPGSLYGVCKNTLQQVGHQLAAQKRLSFAWGRIFHVYGPHESTARLVPSIIGGLLRQQQVACTDGKQVRDYSHVQDVAGAFVALLTSSVQGPVNIGSGQPISVRSLGTLLEQLLCQPGMVKWNAIPTREDEAPFLMAHTHHLNHDVGWYPKFSLTEGLKDTVEWWRRALEKEKV